MIHLDDAQVRALLPAPAEQVALMRETLLALADGSASVTPKSQVVHEPGGFANAMPAAWPERGLLGVKWVTVTPSNRERGTEMIGGLMVLSSADGSTRATMDAAELTAQRTAAVTGASLAVDDRPIAFLGTGVQARSHARVIAALGRGPLTVWGRRPEALEELTVWCAEHTPDLELRTTSDRAEALAGAGVVISGLPIGLSGQALRPGEVPVDVTLLPLDYASVAGAEISRTGTVVADDPEQFESLRPLKHGADYPRASGATGELLRTGRPDGLVVAQNLGSGLGDVVLADAVARAATRTTGASLERIETEEPSDLDDGIVSVRFQGPLFFVSSERVFETVMDVGRPTVVILRLARLERVDASGAQVLAEIVRGLERRGITVLIKGVQVAHEPLFRRVGVLAALRHHKHLFVDFESALEHARSHVERERRTVET